MRYKPKASLWVPILFFMGMGCLPILIILSPDRNGPNPGTDTWLFILALGGPFWALSLPMAVYLYRSCVEITDRGLRWRTAKSGWQSANWSEVSDYYMVLSASNSSRATTNSSGYTRTVELRDGRKFAFDTSWKDYKLLADEIARRASSAKVSEWGCKGARPEDWPRTFGYDPRRLRRLIGSHIGAVCFIGSFFFGGSAFLASDMLLRHQWIWFNGIASLFILISATFIVWGAWLEGSPIRQARQWVGEAFTITDKGFVFDDTREDVFIPWNKVTGYDFNMCRQAGFKYPPCVIATEWGQRIAFNFCLTDAQVFMACIRRLATEGVESRRDASRAEALGGEEARWSGGEEGKGDLVYHARTRTGRSMLLLPWALTACFLLVTALHPLYARPDEEVGGNSSGLPIIALVCAVAGIVGTIAYRRIKLFIGAKGIAYQGMWKRQEMAWDEIREWGFEGDRGRVEAKDGRTVCFTPSLLAFGSEIEKQLNERAATQKVVNGRSEDR